MPIQLNANEARVLGCLMEKSVITPDQYPLTLNALTNACNQKSSREPVMNLSSGDVQHTIRSLQDKHLVRVEENFKSQVEKYTQRLCNTPFSDYQLDAPQFAVMCVLLLRGPRTPGELRANSGRLHTFADNDEVVATLQTLQDGENGQIVTQLPRTPGRKDSEYMHLLGDTPPAPSAAPANRPQDLAQPGYPSAQEAEPSAPAEPALETRVARLEQEVADLKAALSRMMEGSDL